MDRNTVVAAICRLTRRPPGDVQGHLTLGTTGLGSSFGLTALRSVLESQGAGQLPSLSPAMTVDALVDLVTGATAGDPRSAPSAASQALDQRVDGPSSRLTAGPAAPRPVASSSVGRVSFASAAVGLGMDIQEIASLPNADDYREHAFYASNFTPQELATAVLRTNPRAHLCGLFCAKEAAKKSHHALLDVRMSDLSVLPDESGRPVLHVADTVVAAAGLRFLVSITHTETIAAASCIAIAD